MRVAAPLVLALSLAGCAAGVRRVARVPNVSVAEAAAFVHRTESDLCEAGHHDDGHELAESMETMAPNASPEQNEEVRAGARVALTADRLDLFEDAIAAVEATDVGDDPESFQSRALGAQLRLGWAEAELIVAEIMLVAAAHIEAELDRINSDRAIGSERERRRRRVEEIREALGEARYFAACFRVVGEQRLEQAALRIRAMLESNPDDYLSYRLAADLYRIEASEEGDAASWARFEGAVQELEARRPNSTGLKFIRGAAGVRRNEPGARAHLDAALEDDPTFARALVFRALAAETIQQTDEALRDLAQISAHHQLILWVAPLVQVGSRSSDD